MSFLKYTSLFIFVSVIDRANAIRIIDSGVECSMQVCKCNRTLKTGGELIQLPRVKKVFSAQNPVQSGQSFTLARNGKKKHPRHSENATRNMIELPGGNTVKIHIHLITMFNGEKVLW